METKLRDALLDANLQQFAEIMAQAEEPDFSPRYRKSCLRMLANPRGWAKRFSRPLWKKTLQTAVCILLTFTLALGALMGISPTVRAAVMNWFREIREGVVSYTSHESTEQLTPSVWRPTWVPEEFVLRDILTSESHANWDFTRKDGRARLRILCLVPGCQVSGDTGVPDIQPISTTIQGNPAEYYAGGGGGRDLLVWENREGYLFWISAIGLSDQAMLEKVGNHMKPYPAETSAFASTWLPEGHSNGFQFPGVGHQELLRNGDMLTFQYVTDPLCPWETDERREGQSVMVGDSVGMLWEATIPEGQEDTTVEMGSIIVSSSTSHTVEEAGVLIWTDEKSNTAFQLKGVLPKEDLLRIAESVTVVPPSGQAEVNQDEP